MAGGSIKSWIFLGGLFLLSVQSEYIRDLKRWLQGKETLPVVVLKKASIYPPSTAASTTIRNNSTVPTGSTLNRHEGMSGLAADRKHPLLESSLRTHSSSSLSNSSSFFSSSTLNKTHFAENDLEERYASSLPRPKLNFVVAGFAKTGTTFLAKRILGRHPEILMPLTEVHYLTKHKPEKVLELLQDLQQPEQQQQQHEQQHDHNDQQPLTATTTTTQSRQLEQENQQLHVSHSNVLVNNENNNKLQQQQQQQQQQLPRRQRLIGYKAPREIADPFILKTLQDLFGPQQQKQHRDNDNNNDNDKDDQPVKLIIGLRHPIEWFQSLYNYRYESLQKEKERRQQHEQEKSASEEDEDSDKSDSGDGGSEDDDSSLFDLPPPEQLIGRCTMDLPHDIAELRIESKFGGLSDRGVCTELANFHIPLSWLFLGALSSNSTNTTSDNAVTATKKCKKIIPNTSTTTAKATTSTAGEQNNDNDNDNKNGSHSSDDSSEESNGDDNIKRRNSAMLERSQRTLELMSIRDDFDYINYFFNNNNNGCNSDDNNSHHSNHNYNSSSSNAKNDYYHMNHPVFLYEINQLSDKERVPMFLKDLQQFLNLSQPFQIPRELADHQKKNTSIRKLEEDDTTAKAKTTTTARSHTNSQTLMRETLNRSDKDSISSSSTTSDALISFDICLDRYKPLRKRLLASSKTASLWIRRYFLPQYPQVSVSNQEQFMSLLKQWQIDPCTSKTAKSSSRVKNS